MIASIKGHIEYKLNDGLIVQVGGVGLRVFTPSSMVREIGEIGDEVYLHTYLMVREDALTLYGFSTREQLGLFELLISVTGVGPNHALNILSSASVEEIQTAIAQENAQFFSLIPRIGKKLAARIILELKGKVEPSGKAVQIIGHKDEELVSALLALGYTLGEAQAAVRSLPTDKELPMEEKLRLALSYFSTP